MGTQTDAGGTMIEPGTIRKVRRRIIPFIFVLYFVCFLDRINIGFAALTMNQELGISSQQFGLLGGIFFLGYFLFEVPSNLLLHRIGARIWIARILIVWGALATLTAGVQSVHELYLMRFLLGLAEAGYFPGMVLYLTCWLPQREQARAVALLITGSPVVNILGAPISGLILDHVHWLGLASWRWLLILEGAPAVILGLFTFFLLPNSPEQAGFLSVGEKQCIRAELQREEELKKEKRQYSALQVFMCGRVWYLTAIYFGMLIGVYTLNFWAPQLVKSLSTYSNSAVGLVLVIPNLAGLASMILVSRSSDRMLERRFHVAVPILVAGVGFLLLATSQDLLYVVAFLSVIAVGAYAYTAPFWTLPNQFLTGASAAVGIALINSVGNLGGFVGPYVIGLAVTRTGSLYAGVVFVSAALFTSAVLMLALPGETKPWRTFASSAGGNVGTEPA